MVRMSGPSEPAQQTPSCESISEIWAMKSFRNVLGTILAGLLCLPVCLHAELLDTDSYKLAYESQKLTLHRTGSPPIPVPWEWLVPARELEQDESNYVSSFDYSETVTAFPVTDSLTGLHVSSYRIQEGGSAAAAAGRDVFLVLDAEKRELHRGQVDLGVSKGRVRFMGCFGAHHHRFVVEDIDGDLHLDLGVKQEEIRCELETHELEDVDIFVSREIAHPWRWFVFNQDHWEESGRHEGRLPTADAIELPLIDMVKSPVEFVREMTAPRDP